MKIDTNRKNFRQQTAAEILLEQNAVPPKSRTGQGLNFVIHQENYLKVFLTMGI